MNDASLPGLCEVIRTRRYKMICINDSKDIRDFEACRDEVKAAFERILPEKSNFEK